MKIRHELGITDTVDLGIALERTIEWESENPPTTIRPEQFDYEAEDKVLKELGR